jgi:hypothetical protein
MTSTTAIAHAAMTKAEKAVHDARRSKRAGPLDGPDGGADRVYCLSFPGFTRDEPSRKIDVSHFISAKSAALGTQRREFDVKEGSEASRAVAEAISTLHPFALPRKLVLRKPSRPESEKIEPHPDFPALASEIEIILFAGERFNGKFPEIDAIETAKRSFLHFPPLVSISLSDGGRTVDARASGLASKDFSKREHANERSLIAKAVARFAAASPEWFDATRTITLEFRPKWSPESLPTAHERIAMIERYAGAERKKRYATKEKQSNPRIRHMTRLQLREDLRLAEPARRAGWEDARRSFADPVIFRKGDVSVWQTSNGWIAKTVSDGRYEKDARRHGIGFAGLKAALESEGGVAINLRTLPETSVPAFESAGWSVSPERDYAEFKPLPGGDGTVVIRPAPDDGIWELSFLSVECVKATDADPIRLAESGLADELRRIGRREAPKNVAIAGS